jgi:hypothetical protein
MQLSLSLFLPLTGEQGVHTLLTSERERKRVREREKEGWRERCRIYISIVQNCYFNF